MGLSGRLGGWLTGAYSSAGLSNAPPHSYFSRDGKYSADLFCCSRQGQGCSNDRNLFYNIFVRIERKGTSIGRSYADGGRSSQYLATTIQRLSNPQESPWGSPP